MHAYQPERLKPKNIKTGFVGAVLSQHPALLGGALMSIVTMSIIFANAVWYQPDSHPSPMFSTRTVENQVVTTKKVTPSSTKTASVQKPGAASEEVLREVQSALAVRGYYSGKVDGKYGSRTKKAIVSFQQDHSLDQDGSASVRLLSQILLSASATPQEVPVPKVQTIAVKASEADSTVTATAKPVSEATTGLVARIQSGLKNYGYEELVVDGKPGRQTKDAIQSFQLDYGMKITGEPSQSVLNKLQEIGAYKQG